MHACIKDIDISSMGESALKSHAKSEKHKRLVDGGINPLKGSGFRQLHFKVFSAIQV